MKTKYDSDRFRVLVAGERVEDGDYYIRQDMSDRGDPPRLAKYTVGAIVEADDGWTFLRLIEQYKPRSSATRKAMPVCTGVLDYFPDAIRAVANCSFVGNEQHNPGTPMHWDRAKSGDEADALMRHLLERGTVDTDGILHDTKVAWRALALLQKELEKRK